MRMAQRIALFALLLLPICFRGGWTMDTGQAATTRIGAICWTTDFSAALEVARRENKPLWMHFGENPG